MAEPGDLANLRAQLELISKETSFLQKYLLLRKRFEQMEQSNESIINRIQHMKKLVKRFKRDKRHLCNCLDERGDNYRDTLVPLTCEEDQLNGSLRTSTYFETKGSDSEPEIRGRYEHQTALSSIQPLLQAHGMGNLDAAKLRKMKTEQGDSNAPKKPVNAFLMFCTTQRTSIKEEYFNEHNVEIAQHELTKTLAQQWNSLSQEEKKIYYEMCEKEKERCEREMLSCKLKSNSEGGAATNKNLESKSSSMSEAEITSFKRGIDV